MHINTPSSAAQETSARKRRKSRIRTASLILGGAVAMGAVAQGVAFAAPPSQLPGKADALEVKFQPATDYDTNGCYPSPAIGPDGTINGGLKPTGSLSGDCRDQPHLDNANGYSRVKCDNDWCAIAYGFYFEKDQAIPNSSAGGHRHDWEHVVVWVRNDQAEFVSTSAHGDFVIQSKDQVRFDNGTHAKVVYRKDGVRTHNFRLADSNDEPPENHNQAWHYPTLVGWGGFPAGLRDTLGKADFGSATFGLKDSEFNKLLEEAKPASVTLDTTA